MDLHEELKWRGILYDETDGLAEWLRQPNITAYTGFDPTGDSLHVGSLVPIISLARLQRAGHTPIALAGGGTGLIGDPSGKAHERQLLDSDRVVHNLSRIREQLQRFLDFDVKSNPARIVNNADWLQKISFLDFLRDIGKHFTVNYMMHKESVKSRIEREDGISFTEFSYMLLQAYDFYHLHKHFQCSVQAGGSDQWGNITAGIELVRRLEGKKVYGLVYPLVTKADGSKFGKTESGNIWLDSAKTSPYEFFQFWYNTPDSDVMLYLKRFTFLSQDEIAELGHAFQAAPEKRDAQRALAREMTRMVHGESHLAEAEKATGALFNKNIVLQDLSLNELEQLFTDVPTHTIEAKRLQGTGEKLVPLLKECHLAPSNSEAMRMIAQGAVKVNNEKIQQKDHCLTANQSLHNRYFLIQSGGKKKIVIKILPS